MAFDNKRYIDRTIGSVAKLGLFALGELKLTEREFEQHWDVITEFLGELNDERYRFGDVRQPHDTLPGDE